MKAPAKTSFIRTFRQTLLQQDSALCVGLDPEVDKLPPHLPQNLAGLMRFCEEIISATAEFAAAFKINFAFFEVHGQAGWAALEKIVGMIPAELLKIADAKRGDIGNTSRLYAQSVFEVLQFDAMTVNPYLGEDAAAPFLDDESKGVFFLCRTSNPGGKTIQWYPALDSGNGEQTHLPLFVHVAKQVQQWNTKSNAALVVGATHLQELEIVRQHCPALPFLIPGIGAQGGRVG